MTQLHTPPALKPFTLTCLWYGLDGALVYATDGRAALQAFATAHNLTLYGASQGRPI